VRGFQFDWFVTDPGQYRQLFDRAGGCRAVGEMSNAYLFSETAAAEIKKHVPEARIVMLLRNPVERIYSHYLANLRDGKTSRPFREEIDADFALPRKGWWISHNYYETGLYCAQVRRYLDAFGAGQVLILPYDAFAAQPAAALRKLFAFLGVDENAAIDVSLRANEGAVPRNPRLLRWLSQTGLKKKLFRCVPVSLRPAVKRSFFRRRAAPPMPPADEKELYAFYRADVECLERLTGLALPSWKNTTPTARLHG
jgi:hypothetical protein